MATTNIQEQHSFKNLNNKYVFSLIFYLVRSFIPTSSFNNATYLETSRNYMQFYVLHILRRCLYKIKGSNLHFFSFKNILVDAVKNSWKFISYYFNPLPRQPTILRMLSNLISMVLCHFYSYKNIISYTLSLHLLN